LKLRNERILAFLQQASKTSNAHDLQMYVKCFSVEDTRILSEQLTTQIQISDASFVQISKGIYHVIQNPDRSTTVDIFRSHE
jgi:hypothetical protein